MTHPMYLTIVLAGIGYIVLGITGYYGMRIATSAWMARMEEKVAEGERRTRDLEDAVYGNGKKGLRLQVALILAKLGMAD